MQRQQQQQTQIPFGNDNKNGKDNSNGKSKNQYRDPSTARLRRFAQDDGVVEGCGM
jgi:hypothetical protein